MLRFKVQNKRGFPVLVLLSAENGLEKYHKTSSIFEAERASAPDEDPIDRSKTGVFDHKLDSILISKKPKIPHCIVSI